MYYTHTSPQFIWYPSPLLHERKRQSCSCSSNAMTRKHLGIFGRGRGRVRKKKWTEIKEIYLTRVIQFTWAALHYVELRGWINSFSPSPMPSRVLSIFLPCWLEGTFGSFPFNQKFRNFWNRANDLKISWESYGKIWQLLNLWDRNHSTQNSRNA